jgi:hypothetical protein
VLSQLVYEESGENEAICSVVLNRSVKRGQVVVYAKISSKEVRVYEVDFYGGHNATRLMTKVNNIGGMTPAKLYTYDSFYL